jgi:hypothetical protein
MNLIASMSLFVIKLAKPSIAPPGIISPRRSFVPNLFWNTFKNGSDLLNCEHEDGISGRRLGYGTR